jgi:hypothetical protein
MRTDMRVPGGKDVRVPGAFPDISGHGDGVLPPPGPEPDPVPPPPEPGPPDPVPDPVPPSPVPDPVPPAPGPDLPSPAPPVPPPLTGLDEFAGGARLAFGQLGGIWSGW